MYKRDEKLIDHTLSLAARSEFRRARMACVATYKHRIIASANNGHKTHPLQGKYNKFRDDYHSDGVVIPKVHAEMACLAILKSMIIKHNINPSEITLYVARSCLDRDRGMARPCKACMQAIKDLGIRRVFYTTDMGVAEETIL